MSIWDESPDPVYGAMTMVNLAKIHASERDTKWADILFRKAVVLREQAFGQGHPQTKNIADSYAEFQKKVGISGKP